MPFFYSGMWMLPMFIMPIMAILMITFLYKKGFFDTIINTFNEQKTNSNFNQNDLLEKKDKDVFEIINLRYAKGEITKEEYQELKNELRN
ncbi:MAG: SHOCT domain-containing protein [Bacillota bacterium]